MWCAVLCVLLLLLDQISKIYVAGKSGISGTANGQTVTVKELIEGFLNIDYCENEDGMMGIFRNLPNSRLIFIIATVVILVGIFVYLFVSKNRGKWLNAALALIISGAFGNFIDRIFLGYVRDMIHVIINIGGKEYFPYIFNVADMALVVGAIMLILDILFIDKDALIMTKKRRARMAELKKKEAEENDIFKKNAD